jgi:hypothetical protein
MRSNHQLIRECMRLQNQLEALLEEMRIKLVQCDQRSARPTWTAQLLRRCRKETPTSSHRSSWVKSA